MRYWPLIMKRVTNCINVLKPCWNKDSAIVPVYYRVSVRMVSPKVGGFTGKDPFDYTDLKALFYKGR